MTKSSTSSNAGGSSQPLSDMLPWGSPISQSGPPVGNSIDSSCDGNGEVVPSVYYRFASRTLLITDSLSSDARFLLHALSLQFMAAKSSGVTYGSVLWISCGSPPSTEKQIAMGLRKAMQHGLGSCGDDNTNMNGASDLGSVNFVSITTELADAVLKSDDEDNFSLESYVKRLHKRISHWLQHREVLPEDEFTRAPQTKDIEEGPTIKGPGLIIIDGVITLSAVFGDTLTQMFVSSVSASLKNYTTKCQIIQSGSNKSADSIVTVTNLLVMRCSSPDDGGLYNIADLNEFEDVGNASRTKGQKLRSEYSRLLRPWLGAGSSGCRSDSSIFHIEELSLQSNSTPSILYKGGWYELADAIVDVSPLESGYARDVLGRLSFTTSWNGMGWWGGTSDATISGGGRFGSICVNYLCDDSGVRIMRLRSGK